MHAGVQIDRTLQCSESPPLIAPRRCRPARSVGTGDDNTCAYYTRAQVAIRDKRLGALHYLLLTVIFSYVVIYQMVFLQQYAKEGGVIGTVRLSLQEPELRYRAASPPYCSGVRSSPDPAYSFPAPGIYAYADNDGSTVLGQQGQCTYLDAAYAQPFGPEPNALLLPTRITVSAQGVTPLPDCEALALPTCKWATSSTTLQYVPDAALFTLMADHSMAAQLGTLSRSTRQMVGALVDSGGETGSVEAHKEIMSFGPRYSVCVGLLWAPPRGTRRALGRGSTKLIFHQL